MEINRVHPHLLLGKLYHRAETNPSTPSIKLIKLIIDVPINIKNKKVIDLLLARK